MYRLAIECGIINSYSSEQFQEVIGAIENLPDEAQQFLTTVLGIVAPLHYGNLWVTYDEQETLITNVSYHSPSFSPVPLEWLSANPYLDLVQVSLEMLSSKEIFNVIENLGFQVDEDYLLPENRKKFINWVKENIPDIDNHLPLRIYVYALFHQKVMYNVLLYLRRKFSWNTFVYTVDSKAYSVQYPCGAYFEKGVLHSFCGTDSANQTSKLCFFPDDEITKLLTLYGHNRCLNGYRATAEKVKM